MPRGGADNSFSGPLSAIAVVGVTLGVVVMVMAVSILHGFQHEIASKVAGFGSHITLTAYDSGTTTESPVALDAEVAGKLAALPGVRHMARFATKGGMAKTTDQIAPILLRGLDPDADTTFYTSCLLQGHLPQSEGQIALSSTLASRLQLALGDKLRCYFWTDDTYRQRAFTVEGIYNTDLTEMDELYVLAPLATVGRLNSWDSTEAGGYELLVDDLDRCDLVASQIATFLPYDLKVTTLRQAHPVLFSWLDLLNTNIVLILVIMCLVSAVAIVSALLIMIFEKSATIGLLKALGATSRSLRRIFLLRATRLIVTGIVAGEALALLLSLAQQRWQLLKLDPESYSMSHVPVLVEPWVYVAVAAGTLAVCLAALLIPTSRISRISPAETMKTER
jgi:lipoprotein-releasing system permease protein